MIPAIVVNADSASALPIVRALGRRGVPVFGLFRRSPGFREGRAVVRASRYLVDGADYDGPNYETALIAGLVCAATRMRARPVLFPVSDRDVLAVSAARDALAPLTQLLLPPHDLLETLLAPDACTRRAELLGLRVPHSYLIASLADAEHTLDACALPCAVTRESDPASLVARTREELREALQAALRSDSPRIVRELPDAPDSERLLVCAFLDASGLPLVLAAARAPRPGAGWTAIAITPELEDATREVFARLGLVGYASVEWRRAGGDGALDLERVTVGRLPDGAHLDVDMPWLGYAHLTGQGVEDRAPLRPGWLDDPAPRLARVAGRLRRRAPRRASPG